MGVGAQGVELRERMWHRRLSTPSQQVQVVAEHAGRVVGFAVAGPSPDDPPVRDWALRAMYLLAAHHGTGTGQRLLDTAVGTRPCSLWVAEGNARPHAFYARNRFRPDGARTTEPEWEDLAEIRMVRLSDGLRRSTIHRPGPWRTGRRRLQRSRQPSAGPPGTRCPGPRPARR